MIREAGEDFVAKDEVARKRIEALNALSSFVYGLKTQIGDQEGLGGKIDDDVRKTLLALTKETTEWIETERQTASVEGLKEKLAEVQTIVNPIGSKLYESGSGLGGCGQSEVDKQEPFRNHDEL
jgi:heat shock protein 5